MKIATTTMPSSKGNLSVAIHRPETPSGRLAVLCPGFCDSKDYRGLVGLANALCGDGYTAVRFDPTGMWESGGSIADYSMTQTLDDIRHIIDSIESKGSYDTVLVGGHSRGAGTALAYAGVDDRVSGVIAIMPSTGSWLTPKKRQAWQRAGVRNEHRDLSDDPTKQRTFKVPYSFQADRDRYDSLRDVTSLHVSVLFIAGERDTLVVPDDVRALYEQTNEPKQFVVVPGIGHDYRRHPAEVDAVNHVVVDWLTFLQEKKEIV